MCDDTICSVVLTVEIARDHGSDQTRVGNGVVCNEVIPSGVFIIEYVGEVLVEDDAVQRLETCY